MMNIFSYPTRLFRPLRRSETPGTAIPAGSNSTTTTTTATTATTTTAAAATSAKGAKATISESRSVTLEFPVPTAVATSRTTALGRTAAAAARAQPSVEVRPALAKPKSVLKPSSRPGTPNSTVAATPDSTTPARAKRPFPRSPPKTVNRSPLIRRIPSLLGKNEEFVDDVVGDRSAREATPRSKRLRRETVSGADLHRAARESTAMSTVTSYSYTGRGTSVEFDGRQHEEEGQEEREEAEEYSLVREAAESQQLDDLRDEGFALQEAQLFIRMRNRGLEPLLPAHWEVDFPTMPEALFFSDKGNQVGHIDSVSLEGTFQATNALQALVMLGGTVRGRIESKRDPEDRVMAALKKYIQWSVDDVTASNYKEFSEIYPRVILVRSNGKGAEHCEARVRRKMNELAAEVRAEESRLAAAGLPRDADASATIYGIAVAGAVVALLTLDARLVDGGEERAPRTMIILDFSDITLDFWNAIAVALLVIAAREDELERHEFYRLNELNIVPPADDTTSTAAAAAATATATVGIGAPARRGWETRSRLSAAFDADDDA